MGHYQHTVLMFNHESVISLAHRYAASNWVEEVHWPALTHCSSEWLGQWVSHTWPLNGDVTTPLHTKTTVPELIEAAYTPSRPLTEKTVEMISLPVLVQKVLQNTPKRWDVIHLTAGGANLYCCPGNENRQLIGWTHHMGFSGKSRPDCNGGRSEYDLILY